MGISRRRISEMRDIKNYQMLINGDWVDASDGVFESINPSTQTVWSRVPEATEEDVNRAVSAAIMHLVKVHGQSSLRQNAESAFGSWETY